MTLADLFNAPSEVEFEGVTYRLRQPDQVEQGVFQRWLEQRAYDAVGRADVSEDRRRQMDAEVAEAAAAGEYEWGSSRCVKALRNPTGLAKLVGIVCRDQGMSEATARKFVDRKMREVAAALVSKVTSDPKALAAALASLGLPPDYLSGNSSSASATTPSAGVSTNSAG